MIAATWAWALLGIALFLVLGLLAMLALGLAELPGDVVRRLKQSARGARTERGQPLPDEVPEATPEEAAEQADARRDR